MKNLLYYSLLLLMTLYSGATSAQGDMQQKSEKQLIINSKQLNQTIEGWGSSLCWWAAQVGMWNEAKVDSIVDLITSPDKLNMNIFRYNIGGGDDPAHLGGHMVKGKGKRAEMEGFKPSADAPYNWAADKGQRTLMLKIKAKRPDAIFEAFSNSPPFWMTYSGCAGGNIDPLKDNLKPEYFGLFCDYLVDVCKYYKDHYGLEFNSLEPFNESTSNYWYNLGSQEGCHFTPESQLKIIRLLAPRLKFAGLKAIISASDETNLQSCIKVLNVYQSAGDILDKVGRLNTHTYSGTNSERAKVSRLVKSTGKPFWQSETGPGGRKASSFESDLFLAQKQFDDLNIMQPQAWLDWQLMEENNEIWCLLKCNFNTQYYEIVKNFYVRMQITRFFKQGYTMIESGNEEVLAAVNGERSEVVVAILNKTNLPKSYNLRFESTRKSAKNLTAYRTSASENCAKIASPTVKKQSFSYEAPGLTLTTFVLSNQ